MTKKSRRQRRSELDSQQKGRKRLLLAIGGITILALVLFFLLDPFSSGDEDEREPRPLGEVPPAQRDGYYSEYPPMSIDPSKEYTAIFRTDKGDMTLRLFAEESPLTVNNFVFLAREGYFDGLTFHRVIQDFMAQGGDPTGQGGGGPGYQFEDETDSDLVFDRLGLLAMANRGPATNGSQFFITFVPTPHLDGLHTIFGELVDGQDTLNNLASVAPDGVSASAGDVIRYIDIIEE